MTLSMAGFSFHGPGARNLSELLQPLLEEGKPVRIPDDAVVIPYDPEDVQWREQCHESTCAVSALRGAVEPSAS